MAQLLDQLREENQALTGDNAQLKKQVSDHLKRINVLELELENKQKDWAEQEKSKAVRSEQLKKQIDAYIQEVDHCIEWLQNE
ncbi:MAG: hypothetical protein H6563_14475 [Lewinellaceae bacterium]|nr:hypothetical protein [Lewinellaceae bacterium]